MDFSKLDDLIEANLTFILPECENENCSIKNKKHLAQFYHTIEEYNKKNYPTSIDVQSKKEFTDDFLDLVDRKFPRNGEKNDKLDYLYHVIQNHFNKSNRLLDSCVFGEFPINNPIATVKTTTLFVPSKNSLYFLFLANLYCNHTEYANKYNWLDEYFMFICDQYNLTGSFAIDKNLYKILFGKCQEKNKPDGYDITYGYFLLNNTAIRVKGGPIDPAGQTMQEFLAAPSPLDTGMLTYPLTTAQKLTMRRAAEAEAAAAASKSAAASKAAASKSAAASKTVIAASDASKWQCKYGKDCKSHQGVLAGNTYGPYMEHVKTYKHGGGRKTYKKAIKNKKRTVKNKKRTIKNRKRTIKNRKSTVKNRKRTIKNRKRTVK